MDDDDGLDLRDKRVILRAITRNERGERRGAIRFDALSAAFWEVSFSQISPIPLKIPSRATQSNANVSNFSMVGITQLEV